jgi:hypothetical protein
MVSWYQKVLFLVGSQIGSHEVFNSVLMHHNFGGWFLIGHIVFDLIFLVMSSNLFYSPLWKVTTSSSSIFGCSGCFSYWCVLLEHFFAKPISFFSYFLSSLLACYKWLLKICNLQIILVFYFYLSNNNNNKFAICFGRIK